MKESSGVVFKLKIEERVIAESLTISFLQYFTDVCVCGVMQGLLTDDLLKEIVAECAGFNGKGVTLAGFDQLVDKLVG